MLEVEVTERDEIIISTLLLTCQLETASHMRQLG